MFSARGPKAAGEEIAALAQAFVIDSVAETRRNMPFGRDLERGQRLRGVHQRLHRDEVVRITMHQQDRRAGAHLGA